jgi:hypothetical protein
MSRAAIMVALAPVMLAACREGGPEAGDAKPDVSPECQHYLEAAEACVEKAAPTAKPAVEAVYSANRTSIEEADTVPKMDALVKQCKRWSKLLGDNPQCK